MRNRTGLAAVLLFVPFAAAAQTAIAVPKALLFPNYDNVLVGKNQALEGGAYIARANDASANFYNPAGLVAAEKTSLNASSTGYVFSRLTSKSSGESISTSKLEGVPGYFGAVLEPPFTDTRSWRIGFAITRSVSWSPGGIDQTIAPTASDFDRVTFSTEANFGTQLYQVAAAWAPMKALRLGLSGGLAQTGFNSKVTLSGATSPGGQPGQFLSTLRTNGSDSSIVFTLGAQWDVSSAITLGAVFRPPGIRLGGSSVVDQESSLVQASGATSAYFRDENGDFQYKLPLEASVGLAWRLGAVELEFDLRYHDAVSQYDLYKSNVPYQVLTQSNGTSTITTEPPPRVTYAARRVYNGAFGGNYQLGRIAKLHAGFYSALSPVDDPNASPFRKADLYGFTGGVDFQLEKFGASVGAGYQFGTASALGTTVAGGVVSASEISLQSISILYAISYQF
jgi:hypothetical protein